MDDLPTVPISSMYVPMTIVNKSLIQLYNVLYIPI